MQIVHRRGNTLIAPRALQRPRWAHQRPSGVQKRRFSQRAMRLGSLRSAANRPVLRSLTAIPFRAIIRHQIAPQGFPGTFHVKCRRTHRAPFPRRAAVINIIGGHATLVVIGALVDKAFGVAFFGLASAELEKWEHVAATFGDRGNQGGSPAFGDTADFEVFKVRF